MSINLSSKTSLSSATAAAVVALTVAAWPLASQAQRGHDGHTGGGASFSGGHASGQARSAVGDRGSRVSGNRSFGFRAGDGHRGHFRHRHNGVAFGFYDDDYGYGYSSSCEYYRQRALNTGRSYWWRRYRACIAD
jgi:hypothetical protein